MGNVPLSGASHNADSDESTMTLNDETVLASLHLEPADLSSSRRFVKETIGASLQKDAANLTCSVMEARGILSDSADARSLNAPVETDEPLLSFGTAFDRRVLERVAVPSVVWVPIVPLSRDGFDLLQKFEGTVLSVSGDSFVALLVDKTNPGPEEEAEIPFAEIMPGDRELVKPGAMFYWVIGYRREIHGQLSRSSVIRLRRVPSWSPAKLEQAKKTAETFLSFLDLERANNPA